MSNRDKLEEMGYEIIREEMDYFAVKGSTGFEGYMHKESINDFYQWHLQIQENNRKLIEKGREVFYNNDKENE